MNELNDHPEGVSEGAGGEAQIAASENSDQEEKRDGPTGPILLFFLIGLAASLVVGWVIFPAVLYSEKKQPINYNHKLHVENVEESCESCHYFREDGSFSGIPKLESCLECHEETQGEDPQEIKFVEDYVQKDREVPWLVYSRQPDSVFFSHAAHIKAAKLDCVTCHGQHGESETSRIYEYNILTQYSRDIWGKNIAGLKKNSWDRMKMDDCAECHARLKKRASSVQTKKEACFVCHK